MTKSASPARGETLFSACLFTSRPRSSCQFLIFLRKNAEEQTIIGFLVDRVKLLFIVALKPRMQ